MKLFNDVVMKIKIKNSPKLSLVTKKVVKMNAGFNLSAGQDCYMF